MRTISHSLFERLPNDPGEDRERFGGGVGPLRGCRPITDFEEAKLLHDIDRQFQGGGEGESRFVQVEQPEGGVG